ncbi:MAG: hypothetical protein WDM80_00200 [Limisphaerales bacterium]
MRRAVDTGIPADTFVNPPDRGNGLDTMDPGIYQVATHPPLTAAQVARVTTIIPLPGQKPPQLLLFGNPGGRGFAPINFNPAQP